MSVAMTIPAPRTTTVPATPETTNLTIDRACRKVLQTKYQINMQEPTANATANGAPRTDATKGTMNVAMNAKTFCGEMLSSLIVRNKAGRRSVLLGGSSIAVLDGLDFAAIFAVYIVPDGEP